MRLLASLALGLSLVACGGSPDSRVDSSTGGDGFVVAADLRSVIAAAGITTLPGASANAGAAGVFSPDDIHAGTGNAPKLSNTVLSAIPGTPPKILFVGQDAPFDAVLVSIDGLDGSFEIPAAQNPVVG